MKTEKQADWFSQRQQDLQLIDNIILFLFTVSCLTDRCERGKVSYF